MTSENFEYLRDFVSTSMDNVKSPSNWFLPVTEDEIIKAEETLGYKFPNQLRNFYLKVGYGSLKAPHNPPDAYKTYNENYIFPPSIIIDIIIYGQKSGFISQEFLEFLAPEDLPFFHIADSSDFLYMKPKSANPNAVYALGDELVEENFNQFIWRLYYESPDFYADL